MIQIASVYLPAFAWGAAITLTLAATVIFGGTIAGVGLAASCHHFPWTRAIIQPLIHVVMALPVLVLLVWLYYALPLVDARLAFSPGWTAFAALSVSLAAFVADIVFNGVRTLPRAQVEVAVVLLGSNRRAFRHVFVPHALRTMAVPVLGQYVTTLKFTTLASIVGVGELLYVAGDVIQRTYRPVEVYSVVAIIFVIIIAPANVSLRLIERRLFPERR